MKTFRTTGTGNEQTLSEIETDKIPIYPSVQDIESDLANLEEGQIVATPDTGNEVAQPVDVVEKDNLHAVTSNAVSESLSYSETEQKTGGYWIDGKPIYTKVVNIGTVSTSTSVSYLHSISNIDNVIHSEGQCKYSSSFLPIPYVTPATNTAIQLYVTDTSIVLNKGSNISTITDVVVKIEYTKTTD